jgi:eukaryotic-like serine/threonine-protein kinase
VPETQAKGFAPETVGQWPSVPRAVPIQLPPRYTNPRPLAAGGMGEIVLVDDTLLGRPVVLKLLAEIYARDELVRRRFLREANAAARLSGHPHVVTIYDVGEWEGRPFIAMEYLPNGDLHHRLATGRPPFPTTAEWIAEAASALDDAHANGVIHRDVKPANLLLDGRCSVHVADFGIARVVDSVTTSVTMPGTVMGTAGYISPEQARGEPAGGASDIYSLGAVAYELVTGRRPFGRDTEADELDAHLHAPLPPPSAAPGVPHAVDAVFARVMAKDPAARYPTAAAFADALAGALERTDQPTAVIAAPRRSGAAGPMATYGGGGRSRRRRPAGALMVALAALALIAGLAAAYAVTRGGRSDATEMRTITRRQTVERVVTRGGTTVTVPSTTTRTVTVPATSALPVTDASAGHALNDQGYAAMQRGDYTGALPPLRRAVVDLRGAGPSDPYEAYANYNLGYTLLQLGRCARAIAPLERAQRLESSPSVPAALARARACASR